MWAAGFVIFFSVIVWWFGFIDVYDRNFFDDGILILTENLARIGFIFLLAWLIYAPGAAVAAILIGAAEPTPSPAERVVLGFGLGVGLWHVSLLILGIAGLYYSSVMAGLAAIVVLGSAHHFAAVASAANRALSKRITGLRHGQGIPETFSTALVAIAAIWLLLTRGLYPGGGHDYYTHYFYYLLNVLNNHSITPNDVWYHYYYSKGYGLFFLGMLLTDPLGPSLATFCCVVVAAIAMAALAQRIAPGSLWPGCVAALYLSYNLISAIRDGGGEFQKDHELVSALIALIACGVCMARQAAARCWLAMVASSGIAIAIVAQPIGVIIAIYLILEALCAVLRRRCTAAWQYGWATVAVGGTIAAILALNYWQTGLASDQSLALMLRFADTARLDRWGVLPQAVIVAWIRDNYDTVAPESIWALWAMLRQFMRFDRLEVFFAGPAIVTAIVAVRVFVSRYRNTMTTGSLASIDRGMATEASCRLGSLLAFLIAISLAVGRSQHVSFQRSSTFFVPLLLLLGLAVGAWGLSRLPVSWERWRVSSLLPLLLLSSTTFSWATDIQWRHRLVQVTENSLRFFVGDYSFADAYSRQDAAYTHGGINPHALGAWRHVNSGAAIWSTTVNSYCMVPGCWIESIASFKLSPKFDEIVGGPPDKAKELLQAARINYFLITGDVDMLDLLPYSQLFAPDTIGRYLGIKWTDGTAFLLTWNGPDTTPLTPEFFKMYADLRSRPENPWFEFSYLAPQIVAATRSLRAKAWGTPAVFAWRSPPPDGTLNIAEATYGRSCRYYWPRTGAVNTAASGNATRAVRRQCAGKAQCVFNVDVVRLGDPAQGCSKDFSVAYRCADDDPLTVVKIPAEANGKSVNLVCPAR